MKTLITIVALVALSLIPTLSFACPPPPAPGYEGGDNGGGGPLPGDDHSNGAVDAGGLDSENGAGSTDAEVGEEVC